MARAKVPKVKERYAVDQERGENVRVGFPGTVWARRSGHPIAIGSSHYADEKIARALNLLESVERGEVKVEGVKP